MENTEKEQINQGKKKVFLICDDSFRKSGSPFVRFLASEGYTYGHNKGNYGCPWLYVDITTKQFAYGMPGIGIVGVIGDHAITIEEFMVIFNIYKKYENKGLFVFHNERFDYDRGTCFSYAPDNEVK